MGSWRRRARRTPRCNALSLWWRSWPWCCPVTWCPTLRTGAQAAVKPAADISAPTTTPSRPATPPCNDAPPDCRSGVAQPGDTPAFTSAMLGRDEASVTSHAPAPSSMWSCAPPCGEYADSVDKDGGEGIMTRIPRPDSALLNLTAAGDRRAWEELPGRHSVPLYADVIALFGE